MYESGVGIVMGVWMEGQGGCTVMKAWINEWREWCRAEGVH